MKIGRFTTIFTALVMAAASFGSAAVFAVPSNGHGAYNTYSTYSNYRTYNTYRTYTGGYSTGCSLPGNISIAYTGGIHSHIKSAGGKGGIAKIRTAVKEARVTDGDTFYLDAGNFSMGTPFKAAYGVSALELRGLAAIGCEATTIGPDEFGYGTKELGKMLLTAKKKTGKERPYIVCSNIDWEKSLEGEGKDEAAFLKKAMGKYGVKKFKSITKGNKKIVVMGIVGEKAAKSLEAKGIYFTDPAQAAKDTLKKIKKKVKDVDMIVCLGQFGSARSDEAKAFAEEFDKKISVIVTGNSRKGLSKPVKEGRTRIVTAGNDSRLAGVITYKEKTWGKEDYKYSANTLKRLGKDTAEDPEAAKEASKLENILNKSYFKKHGYKAGQKLAKNDISFPDTDTFKDGSKPDAFGDLLVDSYILGAKESKGTKADIAIASSKAIDKVLPTGTLTVNDAFDVSSGRIGPDGTAGSSLVKVYFTGKELKNIAEAGVSVIPGMEGACFYTSGIKYSYNTHRVKYNRVFAITDEEGNKLDDDKLYAVITDFEFLDMVSGISDGGKGMIPVEIRDKDGNPVAKKNWKTMTAKKNGEDLKIWQAVADKLDSFDGRIPAEYSKARTVATESTSFSPKELFDSPNRAGMIAYCVALVIILLIVLAVILIVSKRRRSYASIVKRENKMFSRKQKRVRKAMRKRSQKKIFSNRSNRYK